jgi:hypothetical protein
MPNVTVRLSKEMYWRLRELSIQQGIPLERFIVSILHSALVAGIAPSQAEPAVQQAATSLDSLPIEPEARPVSS